MKFAKLLILLSGLLIVLNNCSSLGEAGKVLRNQKESSTNEFFIKKKDALAIPPNYDKIPEPGSTETKKESAQSSIKKIIKKNNPESESKKIKSSSTEESILKRIK